MKSLMDKLHLSTQDRVVAQAAIKSMEEKNSNVLAIQISEDRIVTGKESELLSAPSAAILNVIKELSGIPDDTYLLSPGVIDGIYKMKQKTSYKTNYCLNLPEVLIALSICAMTNPIIEKAINQLDKLKNCEAHASYIIEKSERNVLKNLGINLTCEPKTYV